MLVYRIFIWKKLTMLLISTEWFKGLRKANVSFLYPNRNPFNTNFGNQLFDILIKRL